MYNKKLLKNITDGLDKAKKPATPKDIIYDPKGQWKHPGEVTRIPSNRITMKGVGYPVLGVPNKGAPSMMQPNQDYNFPEADYVDEYPHMDGGGQIYTYSGRPGSYYKKDVNGKWLIKNEGTKGKYVVVDDPKGTRTKALNAQAKPMSIKKPTVQQSKYDPLYDTSSVQKAGTTQVSNLMKKDTPEFITNPIKYKKDQEAANIQQKKYNDSLKYTKDYMQSPKYKEMLKRSTGNTNEYNDISKDRLKNLASIPNVEILKKQPADKPRTAAYSRTTDGKITMLPKGYNSKGTFVHELSHSADRPTGFLNKLLDVRNNIPESDRDYINKHKAKSLIDSRDYRVYNILKSYNPNMNYKTANKEFQDFYTDYVGEDTETRARLNSIRQSAKENGLYDPFTQGVSPSLYYNKLKNFKFETGKQSTLDPMHQLKSTYSDEEIIWMLNNISKNENQEEDVNEGMARKGGSLKSKKYTKNLDGTNYLFAESSLFKKPKKLSKKRIFHPHAKYYKTGGESGCPEGYAFNPVTGECVEWDPEVWESEEQPTSYDPVGDIIYMNPNDRPEGMSDEEYQQMYQDQIEHEQLHRLQWINGGLKGDSGTPLRMPSTVDNQEYDGEHYYNRRGQEESYLHDMFNQDNPELAKFIPSDVIYDKVINPSMYDIPWTEEGEARGYEGALHNGMESLFPKRKTGGALLTKKVTCKKCGWKWDAADGGDDITTCHKCGGQGLVHAQDGGENEPWNPDYEQPSTYEFQPLSAEQIAQREFEQEQERLRQEEERFRLEQETWTPEQWDEYRIKEEARKYQQALINEPKYFDEGIQFVKDWHNSPMYNQMVLNSYKGDQKSADYVTKLRKQNIDSIPSLNIVNSRTTKYGASAPMAWSFSDSGQIEVFPSGFEAGPSTYVHEGLHSSDRPRGSFKGSGTNYPSWMLYKDPRFPNEDVWFDRTMPLSDQKYITKNRSANYKDSEAYNIALKEDPINFKAPSDEEIKNEIIAEGISPDDPKFQTTFNKYKKWYTDDVKTYVKGFKENWKEYGHNYVSQPTEVRARLGEFRYYAKKAGIYDPFTEQLTPETYQKFINTYKDDKNEDAIRSVDDLREQYTDEEIMWLLNNISKTNDSAKELDVASEGGSFELDLTPEEIQEYAKGGYIVEDISVPSLNQKKVGGNSKLNKFIY
jgi:hypothetical protein